MSSGRSAAAASGALHDGDVIRVPSHKQSSRKSKWNFLVGACRLLRLPSPTSPSSNHDSVTLSTAAKTTTHLLETAQFVTHPSQRPSEQLNPLEQTAQGHEVDTFFTVSRPIPFADSRSLLYFPLADDLIGVEQRGKLQAVAEVVMQNFEKDSKLCGKVAGFDLVMVGHTAADAKPTIIISVPKNLQKRARKVVEKPHVRARYESHFRVLCGPLRLLGHDVDIDTVDILFNPGSSLSGSPVVRHDTREQISAVACVLAINGQPYALTAGHPYNHLGNILGLDEETKDSDSESDDGDDPYDGIYDKTASTIGIIPAHGVAQGAPQSDHQEYYREAVKHCHLSRISSLPGHDEAPKLNLDWALVELDSRDLKWGTKLSLGTAPRSGASIDIEIADGKPPCPQQLRPVTVMIPFLGPRSGYIRPQKASIFNWDRAGYPSSTLWTVALSDDTGIQKGISGALIIDNETHRAYGHVVAANPMGDLYIAPLEKTMDQISEAFGSSNVRIWKDDSSIVSTLSAIEPMSTPIGNIHHDEGPSSTATAVEEVSRNAAVDSGSIGTKALRHLSMISGLFSKSVGSATSSSPHTWIGNPKTSIGELAFRVSPPGSASPPISYWEVTGPAQEEWKQLGPEIAQELGRHRAELGPHDFSHYRMYMVGRDEESAEPTLLFFSPDGTAEMSPGDVIQKSHILNRYPGLRLAKADDKIRPQISLMATAEMRWPSATDGSLSLFPSPSPALSTDHLEREIWTSLGERAFGRRLLIGGVGGEQGETVRYATGGPILRICDRVFQLTAGHVFRQAGVSVTTSTQSQPSSPTTVDARINNHDNRAGPNSTAQPMPPQPSSLGRIGKLSLLPSEDDPGAALDYALIELEGQYRGDSNSLPVTASVSQRTMLATGFGDIPDKTTNIATMTASMGFVGGSLSGIPSYVQLPGTYELQALYPVTLDKTVHQGDCGSAIVDTRTGKIYGHIVCGVPGTSYAYIVPATSVMRDIANRLRQPVFLNNTKRGTVRDVHNHTIRKNSREVWGAPVFLASFASYAEGNRQSVEFASKSYLAQRNQGMRLKSKQLPKQTRVAPQNNSNSNNWHDSQCSVDLTCVFPVEVLCQILGHLSALDIIRLRLVSTSWNYFVCCHEGFIATCRMEVGETPMLVFTLYPVGPSTSKALDLWYIAASEHRIHQAAALSRYITEGLTVDMFLQKSRRQRQGFEDSRIRMQQRITTLLVIISHFFDKYREALLELCHSQMLSTSPSRSRGLSGDRGSPPASLRGSVERSIMAQYSDQALLETHQFFPLLLSFLDRLLRPPSYLTNVERFMTNAIRLTSNAPPAGIQVAILCIGGLPFLLQLVAIKDLEQRQTAVRDWYSQILYHEQKSQGSSRNLLPQGLPLMVSSGEVPAPASLSASSSGNHDTHPGVILPTTSLTRGPPMGSLHPSESALLLRILPKSTRDVWLASAEKLLLDKNVVRRAQDFQDPGQVMGMLISSMTAACDQFPNGVDSEGAPILRQPLETTGDETSQPSTSN